MKKRFLLTSALMLLLTVLALTSATYAWFSMSTTNRINDITLTASSADGGLEISSNGTVWNNTSTNLPSPSLSALDITTDDGKTFYKSNGADNATGEVTKVKALASRENKDYYEFPFYLRTSVAGTISLDLSRSYVVPASLREYLDDSTTPFAFDFDYADDDNYAVSNSSALGAFTRDWIAAAARVSLQVTGYQHSGNTNWSATTENVDAEKPFVCEPFATTAALKQNTVTNSWDMLVGANAKVKQNSILGIANDPDVENGDVYTLSGTAYKDSKHSGTTLELLSNNTENIIEIGNDGYDFENGQTAIVQLTLRIWIEGQDDEAKAALALGQFMTSLTFTFDANPQADFILVNYAAPKFVVDDKGTVATNDDEVLGIQYTAVSGAITDLLVVDGEGTEVAAFETLDKDLTAFALDEAIAKATADGYKLRIVYLKEYDGKEVRLSSALNASTSKGDVDQTHKYVDVAFN
jgi:hypothetical protein